jgi:hypothetical protein
MNLVGMEKKIGFQAEVMYVRSQNYVMVRRPF